MASTATVSPPTIAAAGTVVLPNVNWDTHERLLADDAGRRSPRLAYDRGELAIVIEVGHPSLDKLPIYAELGIPEVWRSVGDRVRIYALAEGGYQESPASQVLPPLTGEILTHFLVESRARGRLEWTRMVRDWMHGQHREDRATG